MPKVFHITIVPTLPGSSMLHWSSNHTLLLAHTVSCSPQPAKQSFFSSHIAGLCVSLKSLRILPSWTFNVQTTLWVLKYHEQQCQWCKSAFSASFTCACPTVWLIKTVREKIELLCWDLKLVYHECSCKALYYSQEFITVINSWLYLPPDNA